MSIIVILLVSVLLGSILLTLYSIIKVSGDYNHEQESRELEREIRGRKNAEEFKSDTKKETLRGQAN